MKSLFKVLLAVVAFGLVVPVLGLLAPASTVPEASAAIRQTGRTILLPPIVQPGARVGPADRARLVGRVKFRPARKGRPVVIQRRVGNRPWQKVTVRRQNRAGVVSFKAAARNANGRLFAYRGVAKRWNALSRKAARPQRVAVWKQKFSDEFTGPALDLTKWNYRFPGQYSTASDRTCSASDPDAVRVKGGKVSLLVTSDTVRDATGPCQGVDRQGRPHPNNTHWYHNGHIGTAQGIDSQFKFGVAAARIKFDRNVGAHGSFWLQSTVKDRPNVGPARDGAEIDAVEYFGKNFGHGDIYQFIHYNDRSGEHHKVPSGPTRTVAVRAARRALKGKDDWFKRYHVFSVEWTPRGYTFRVDGIKTRRITEGVSRVPEYLILSMLSSGWELERMPRRTLPNATQVDWVRFWQK